MSVMWSLVNISKGQQFSLMLCALCLIVQWSCHCSAEDPVHSINLGAQSDVTSTIENKLNTSIAIATAAPGDSNTSALRSAENSSDQIRIDVTTLQSTQNMLNHGDIILTTLSSTTDYKFIERGTNSNLGMQGDSKPSKADQPVVLISLLTCGLIVAAMILAAYYRMHKRSWTPQSKRLDEEPDAQDHDSTMFSVASEDQSDAHAKPKLNGDTQENGENQRPAAAAATGNGHQRKVVEEADTEL